MSNSMVIYRLLEPIIIGLLVCASVGWFIKTYAPASPGASGGKSACSSCRGCEKAKK